MEINKLYKMDCIDGMGKLYKENGQCVDAVITDPPYNISIDNGSLASMGRKGFDFGEWDKGFDLVGWIEYADKLLKNGGNLIIFNSWKNLGGDWQLFGDERI